MKKIFALAAGVASIAVLLFATETNTPRKAPELAFSVPGQGQKLLSQYRGRVVALEFIFTTCPHCQAASRVMTKFQEEYSSRGFQALDVAINDNADLLVDNFVKDYQVGFPVGWTTRDQMLTFMGFSMAERFVVPQLVLIDRKGVIHYQTPATSNDDYGKLMKEDAIRQHIEELLAQNNSASRRSSNGTKVAVAKKTS
ncbi:MAG: TlpA family protein disulfide reductase [Acidobacteriaceae bacterium]|nr:TlpA family protein disulfide reductase [Acidobacteriaceae bacterium]MBV9781173.1 TlpA family protein disulfide reductase [Acidobacteriaceae bacterium]